MRLYFLRHAEALKNRDDALRRLSDEGKRSLEKLTEILSTHSVLEPLAVWHSPLLRAVETAQLVAEKLGWKPMLLLQHSGLLPDDDPADLCEDLQSRRKDLLIVGHEPFLSALATLLLTGDQKPVKIRMKKSSLLCLARKPAKKFNRDAARWRVQWHLTPELFE